MSFLGWKKRSDHYVAEWGVFRKSGRVLCRGAPVLPEDLDGHIPRSLPSYALFSTLPKKKKKHHSVLPSCCTNHNHNLWEIGSHYRMWDGSQTVLYSRPNIYYITENICSPLFSIIKRHRCYNSPQSSKSVTYQNTKKKNWLHPH